MHQPSWCRTSSGMPPTIRPGWLFNTDPFEVVNEPTGMLALPGSIAAGLLAGHGLYAWGRTMEEAKRHLEGIEFLLACALEERRLSR